MTVKILSGGAAALTIPDKPDKPDNAPEKESGNAVYMPLPPDVNADITADNGADNAGGVKPITVVEREREHEYRYDMPKVRHRRGKGIGFGTLLLIQLIACGLLFTAAWAVFSLASAETASALREVVGKFTGASS